MSLFFFSFPPLTAVGVDRRPELIDGTKTHTKHTQFHIHHGKKLVVHSVQHEVSDTRAQQQYLVKSKVGNGLESGGDRRSMNRRQTPDYWGFPNAIFGTSTNESKPTWQFFLCRNMRVLPVYTPILCSVLTVLTSILHIAATAV